jgi:hypothetical protein
MTFETIQQVLINRLSKEYRKEINSWENLIRLTIPTDKLLIWYPFDKIIGNGKVVKSIETIKVETNNLIDDLHFSESGQTHIASILVDMILNTKKNII